MASETLSFEITGNSTSATKAFRDTAAGAATASAAARELNDRLAAGSKTAQVSAQASAALARTDAILADALREVAVAEGDLTRKQAEQAAATEEATRQLAQEGRAADVAAAKTRLAGSSATAGASAFSSLASPMAIAVGAGVALSPILVTVGTGLAGVGLAGYSAVAPILQAASATGGLAANMSTLNPVQQVMARQLLSLEGTASGFAKSLQPEVVSIWGSALGAAGTILHDVQPVAKATGDALASAASTLARGLKTSEWTYFFTFMGKTAGPDVQLVTGDLGELLALLPRLLTALQPTGVELLELTGDVTGLANGVGELDEALGRVASSSSVPESALGKFGEAVKTAFGQALPGGAAASLLQGALGAIGGSSGSAASGVRAVAAQAQAAAPKVGTLAGDVALLGTDTTSSTTALQAFSDLWDQFVGKSVTDQQAVLNVRQAFESYAASVKQSGRESTAAQLGFLSIFDAIGSGLTALQKNGASVSALNSYYQTSITRLQALHGLTPAQRADIASLTKDYAGWAGSVSGLSGNVVTAAGDLRNDFLSAISLTHKLVPAARADASDFADAILKTGSNSAATAGDRATLIKDLESSGLSAAEARALVVRFQDEIDGLHGKTVKVGVTASASGTVSAQWAIDTARAHAQLHFARGGEVPGRAPGPGDNMIAAVRSGEYIVSEPSVRKYGVGMMHKINAGSFASGGLVGYENQAASQLGTFGSAVGRDYASAVVAAFKAAASSAASAGAGSAGAVGGAAGAVQALVRSMAAARGWTGALWNDLNAVEMREAGWNLNARNPTSGAYGIAQGISGPSWYYQWPGGNPGTAVGQGTGFLDYIAQRYGSPAGAWAHEQAYNWYGNGLDGVVSKRTLIGVGERGPERVQVTPLTGRGSGGGTMSLTVNIYAPVGSKAELKTWLSQGIDELANEGKLAYALRRSPSAA